MKVAATTALLVLLFGCPAMALGQAEPSADPVGDLVGQATAGQAPGAQPSDATPAAADAEPILLPAPVIKAGKTLRYDLVSTVNSPGAGGPGARRTQQTLQLEVLQPAAGGKPAVVRYSIVDGTAENDSLGRAMLSASKGVATDFEADPHGRPLRLTDWPKVRSTMLEHLALDPAAPPDAAAKIKPSLLAMDPVAAIAFAIPEVVMIADMQGWGAASPGRHDEPQAALGGANARLVSWRDVGADDDKTCAVRLGRTTEVAVGDAVDSAKPPHDRLQTTAEVSTTDGWVVSLSQTSSRTTQGGQEIRTWKLTRETPPGCGG